MKKTNMTRFAKTALQVSKQSKRPIIYHSREGQHIIACSYFFIRTSNEDTFRAILGKIPESKVIPDKQTADGVVAILDQTDKLWELTNTGIVAEEQYGFRRFLMAEDFVVTINDDFLYIFDGDYVSLSGRGPNAPVIVTGHDYTAGILPLRHRSNEAALATMHRLIGRSGWQPIREEA